jgi:CRISPR/Cas system-associated exonuclease Cas4 (RecB family)
MKIDHISASRESLWEECQEKYRFRYHLKIIPDVPTPFYFTFGKIVHKIIEEHTRAKGEKTLAKVKSDVLSGAVELEPGKKCPHLDNESHVRLSKHLSNYTKLADKVGFEGDVEWPFYQDLEPPNSKMIKGFIDRLIIKDGSAFIIDYKTTKPSRWRKDHTTITKDLQLACYSWIVMKNFGIEPSKIRSALYYLDDAKLVPVRFSEKTLMSVPERLVKVYNDIVLTAPEKAIGRVGDHCRRCDYRDMCKFYRLT